MAAKDQEKGLYMFVYSHFYVGRYLADHLSFHQNFSRKKFVFGNMKPDLHLPACGRPHKARNSFEFVMGLLEEAAEKGEKGADASCCLGVACHYLTDFFTYPHSERFEGKRAEHLLYEKRLHRKILTMGMDGRLKLLLCAPCSNLKELRARLELLLGRYEQERSMEADVTYALTACLLACSTISQMWLAAEAAA